MSHVEIILESFLRSKGVSKNKVCKYCEMQRTQLNKYCHNEMERVDLSILARLCDYLECEVSDLLEFRKD